VSVCNVLIVESLYLESSLWYTGKLTSAEYLGQVRTSGSSVKVKVTGAKHVCVSCSRLVYLRLKDDLV